MVKYVGDGWAFADLGSSKNGHATAPGFYLAFMQSQDPDAFSKYTVMEAFDTLEPDNWDVTFEQFKAGVLARNPQIEIQNNQPATYETSNGDRIEFVIWSPGRPAKNKRRGSASGAEVLSVDYADDKSPFALGGAEKDNGNLVNGTVLTTKVMR